MSTALLYDEDPYRKDCSAHIIRIDQCENHPAIVLDQTIFHPQGGGQPGDKGKLVYGKEECVIIDTKKIGNEVFHLFEGNCPEVGTKVKAIIDWEFRYAHMVAHTAEHIFFRALYNATNEKARVEKIDLAPFGGKLFVKSDHITPEILKKATIKINELIMKNKSVSVAFSTKETLFEDFPRARVKLDRIKSDTVRLIVVDSFDVAACSGAHLNNTREIRFFSISKVNITGNTTIISFSVGRKALHNMVNNAIVSLDVSQEIGIEIDKLKPALINMKKESDTMYEKFKKISKELGKSKIDNLQAEKIGNVSIYKEIIPIKNDELIKIANKLKKEDNTVILLGSDLEGAFLVFASHTDLDISQILSQACKLIGGGGGGNASFASGGGRYPEKIQEALDMAYSSITSQISMS